MVQVKILRDYPVGRRVYRVGETIEMDAKTADALAKTSPPFVERVPAKPAPKKKAAPKLKKKVAAKSPAPGSTLVETPAPAGADGAD